MFAVDDVLVADDLVNAPFCCNLGACHGACCVHGDSGAPLESEERAVLEEILPVVRKYLRQEAIDVIEHEGVWSEVGKEEFATTCVDGAECVFVTYDGPVAKCAIQMAHEEGRIDFPKPISCHLFPVRVEKLGEHDALNYERVFLCTSAVRKGRRDGVMLHDFLRTPLTRKYGQAWYERFRDACEARERDLQSS